MADYYNILGISKSASDDEIKNAYRKMARSHHPDKGGDKETFQKIQEAYETLSDPNKRDEYDNPSPFGNINNLNFNFNNSFFKHNQSTQNNIVKKNDYYYVCKIALREVYFGTLKKLKVQRTKICKGCIQKCNRCDGSGQTVQHLQMGPFTQIVQKPCGNCVGTGKINIENSNCVECKSTRKITEEMIFEINIKPGVDSGERFEFKDWGEQPIKDNEIAGSFIVTIEIDKDLNFTRNGLNLKHNVSLTLKESIIGKQITIPHFNENIPLDTKGFGVINPNKEYILYNKGLIDSNGKRGNVQIKFIIQYQDRTFTELELQVLKSTFEKIDF